MGHFDNHLEVEFIKATTIEALKARHSAGDINGLLEYALLIVEENRCFKLRLKFLEKELTDVIADNLRQSLSMANRSTKPGQG
jgi:hypothetical protein